MNRALRTALLYVVPAGLIVVAWLRLERPDTGGGAALALAMLALLPALFASRWRRAAAVLVVSAAAAWIALDVSLLDVLRGRHDFFGPLGSRLANGSLEFYDVVLPFDARGRPLMEGALLIAVFLFCLALAFAVASRRPLAAGLVLVAGAGWPATLLSGTASLLLGVAVLGALLLLWAGMRETRAADAAPALVAGGAILVCALAASTSPAVAKSEFLRWESWDLHTETQRGLGVSYVWDSDYSGLRWPKKRTVVLTIKAPSNTVYWRATALDAFRYGRWVEDPAPAAARTRHGREEVVSGGLVPARARRDSNWVRQEVTVEALRDTHLVGASVPVAFEPGGIQNIAYGEGGIALATDPPDPGSRYAVWSYEARPTPRQLARSRPVYPAPIAREWNHLGIGVGVLAPPFGTEGRNRIVDGLLGGSRAPEAYRALWRQARAVVGRARTPYAAVVALESWFRDSGRFVYDQHPPQPPGTPPLVAFVTRTHRGYCQHFAGAMALMLRYLGIPARVAVGFTSGRYDGGSGTWTVTDHDAHAWVEVWFRGYGWLPFDPTPGRGSLGASYTASSNGFDASAAAAVVRGAGAGIRSLLENRARAEIRGFRGERPFARVGQPLPSARGAGGAGHASLLRLLAIVLASVLAGIVVLKLARRKVRYLTRDPRRVARACRRELIEFLSDQHIDLPPSVTVKELGQALREELAVNGEDFVVAACRARFASPRDAAGSARAARTELRSLLRRVRASLGAADRVLGALSLRSLRAA